MCRIPLSIALVGTLAVIGSVCSCRSPTEVTIDITTDVPCANLKGTTITVGTLGTIESLPAAVVATACDDKTGRVGSTVLIPSGALDDELAFKVVGGDGIDAESCVAPKYADGCIVVRRAMKFIPHTALSVPVFLGARCKGVACDSNTTCSSGACVPATAPPISCNGTGTCAPPGVDGGVAMIDASSSASDASATWQMDGGVDSGVIAPTYHDVTNASFWSSFDITTVDPDVRGFVGAVFDKRYIYFVPFGDSSNAVEGRFAQYDTHGDFASAASWKTFDATTVNAGARGFAGGVFDGKHYMYFAPNRNGMLDGVVLRYDTSQPFDASPSWATYDTSIGDWHAEGYNGAVFDGRFVYFVPWANGNFNLDGLLTRYDTTGAFGAGGSWSFFDMTSANPRARGFVGGVFDQRYIYFAPYGIDNVKNSVAARYDTKSDFGTQSSYETFDLRTVDVNAAGFEGAISDGRYIYFSPNSSGSGFDGVVARYDSQGAFTSTQSWSVFDVSTVDGGARGFLGGSFDGRYVYFIPQQNGAVGGVVARYDTQAVFTSKGAWATFSTASFDATAVGFKGAAYDGQYLYLAPHPGGHVARFDTKTPASLPAGILGSNF